MQLIWFNLSFWKPAAKIKLLAFTLFEVAAQAQPSIKGVNNVFSNQSWYLGLPDTWISLQRLHSIAIIGSNPLSSTLYFFFSYC